MKTNPSPLNARLPREGRIAARLAHRVIEGQAFVLDPKENVLHRLNPSASLVWKALSEGKTPGQAAQSLAQEFEVGLEEAGRDTASFISELRDKGLLEDA
ncbi:MAG: PqqD family protein [Elusimicrobiota bacterium]|jgi:hypothetical protein